MNYTVTFNSSGSEVDTTSLVISNQTKVSILFLEDALADAVVCVPIMFLVVASVTGTEDSVAAVAMESLPFFGKSFLKIHTWNHQKKLATNIPQFIATRHPE